MSAASDELESPFASFTDLLTGIVVIFILLASILALNQEVSESELDERRAELQRIIVEQNEELDRLVEHVSELGTLTEELSMEREFLQGQVEELVIVVGGLEEEVAVKEAQLGTLLIAIGEANDNLTAAQSQAVDAAASAAANQLQVSALEGQLAGLLAERTAAESELNQVRSEVLVVTDTYETASARAAGIRIEIGQLQEEVASLEAQRTRVEIQVTDREVRLQALQNEIERIQQRVAEVRSGTGQPSGQPAVLATVVAGLAERGYPEVSISRGAIVLPESVLFDRGSDVIRDSLAIRQVRETLEEILPCMSSGMTRQNCVDGSPRLQAVLIEGHADTTGDERLNQILSIRRAVSVYDALLQSDQLASARAFGTSVNGAALFAVAGYGETNLAVPTGDEVDEPLNRRIELRLIFQDAE